MSMSQHTNWIASCELSTIISSSSDVSCHSFISDYLSLIMHSCDLRRHTDYYSWRFYPLHTFLPYSLFCSFSISFSHKRHKTIVLFIVTLRTIMSHTTLWWLNLVCVTTTYNPFIQRRPVRRKVVKGWTAYKLTGSAKCTEWSLFDLLKNSHKLYHFLC